MNLKIFKEFQSYYLHFNIVKSLKMTRLELIVMILYGKMKIT